MVTAYAGGLAGRSNRGTIYNCSVSGTVSGTTPAGLNDFAYVGGLVGQNFVGLIRNSYATAVLRAEGDFSRIGGLVGESICDSTQ